MTKFVKLIIFLNVALAAPSLSLASGHMENDKQLHYGASFGISAVSYISMTREHKITKPNAYWAAVGLTLGVGVLKEISDEKFDWTDMKWNLLGAMTGPLLVWTFD